MDVGLETPLTCSMLSVGVCSMDTCDLFITKNKTTEAMYMLGRVLKRQTAEVAAEVA